jgi:hypothetical protein
MYSSSRAIDRSCAAFASADSQLGVANGAYEGLAGLLSTLSANDTLEFALSDQSFAEVNGITRF